MQARLLSEGKLHRQRRGQYQDNNRKMDALWDDIQPHILLSAAAAAAAGRLVAAGWPAALLL